MDRGLETGFNVTVNAAKRIFEGGEIMSPITYSGASCNSAARRQRRSSFGAFSDMIFSTSNECCATDRGYMPFVWPFQRLTRASPWAISRISTSIGEGSSRSSRRPLSMRCHARVWSMFRRDDDRRLRGTGDTGIALSCINRVSFFKMIGEIWQSRHCLLPDVLYSSLWRCDPVTPEGTA